MMAGNVEIETLQAEITETQARNARRETAARPDGDLRSRFREIAAYEAWRAARLSAD